MYDQNYYYFHNISDAYQTITAVIRTKALETTEQGSATRGSRATSGPLIIMLWLGKIHLIIQLIVVVEDLCDL